MGELNLSGKVLHIRAGDMLPPAQCLMCGVGSADVDKTFMSISRDLDEYGMIYFCLDCGVEIGLAAGCVTGKRFDEAQEELLRQTTKNIELEAVVERLGDGFDSAILNYLSARGASISFDGPTSNPSPEINSVSATDPAEVAFEQSGNNPEPTDSEPQLNESESESSESGSSEGPNDSDELTSDDSDTDNSAGRLTYQPSIEL